MSDRGTFWPAPPDWASARIVAPGVTISIGQDGQDIWLLSGDKRAMEARVSSLSGSWVLLPIAPDRIMLVTSRGAALEEGWHATGLAISDLSQAYVPIDIHGPETRAVLAMGSPSLALDPSPRAAAVGFAGLTVLVQPLPDGARLYVEQSQATHLWHWLSAACRTAKDHP